VKMQLPPLLKKQFVDDYEFRYVLYPLFSMAPL
jgi:hypothetical protein